MPFTVADVVYSRYRIVSLLGQGGMGKVYRAWDLNLNIPVALKEMIPDPSADPQALGKLRQQFRDEARIVASLDHPSLVRVTDYFSAGQSECLVMNYVEGESLAERIEREGAQPEGQVLSWAQQLLDALAYCHARNVIHRDIKPQNVIITLEGRPVLVDFGLVKLWDPQDPHTQTIIRTMGTPEYAPPEQYGIFADHTDPRSDLYSLGALLYHALTGTAPLAATDRMARPATFQLPRALNPHVSPHVEQVILKAMELPIDNRFASAQEMAQALRQTTAFSPVTARSATATRVIPAPAPVVLPQRTNWLWWGLGALGLLIVLLIVAAGLGRALLGPSGDRTATATDTPLPPVVVGVDPTTAPVTQVVASLPAPTAESTHSPLPTVPAPTAVPPLTPVPTVFSSADVRAAARQAVESFQEARDTAYQTWDTTPYYDVLVGEALESSLAVIEQLRAGNCRYQTTAEAEMAFRYEEESASRIVVIAHRVETQRRECAGSVEYACQAFDGRYVVELWGDRWVITSKSVENYQAISPCP